MNNTFFPPMKCLMVTAIYLLLTLQTNAQNAKEAVILYNTEPVKAEITPNGEVVRIIGPEFDYLKGFKLISYDYTNVTASDNTKLRLDPFRDINTSEAKGYEIKFESGFATLNQNALKELDEVVAKMTSEPNTKILIADFEQYEADILARNRVNSIRKYLKLKGIDEGRVSLNRLKGVYPDNVVRIIFVQ